MAICRRQKRAMNCGNRRVPGWSELAQPAEEGIGGKPWSAHHARAGRQCRQEPRNQAMGMEQRQHVQQPISGPSANVAPAL